ncbi:hypothetical protein GQ53DRAFT_767550 [Thozetella sp. PMI_491]|nr:hypothetical protein GQ53DRAFT_767550 [Thozetella sp. PMI_491]
MSFLTEAALRRVATLQVPRTVATSAPRAAFSSSVIFQKSTVESAKEGLKSVDRAVSDKLVDGINIGATVADKMKEAGSDISQGKASGKAAELRGEVKGKASELAGKAKGAAAEAKGEVKQKLAWCWSRRLRKRRAWLEQQYSAMVFPYPPLPAGDGLRILTLRPGAFWEPLAGDLVSVPFAAKPKYVALSYTWADPDQEHAGIPAMPILLESKNAEEKISQPSESKTSDFQEATAAAPITVREKPSIILNGQPLSLFHNVTLALRFLRSPTHPLTLWVDAICIDQSSILERNAQVALMAFIFTRAVAVVSWLGVPTLDDLDTYTGTDPAKRQAWAVAAFDSQGPSAMYDWLMNFAWEKGDSRDLAGRLAARQGRRGADHVLFGPETNVSTEEWERMKPKAALTPAARLLQNSYWERLWVVQEVCLPRNLYFVFGGEVLTEGVARQMKRPPLMDRLLSARSNRFSDAMRLEALIERFLQSGCAEVRDRVFGLVGLANDVDSFALGIPSVHPVRSESVVGEPGVPPEPHGPRLERAATTGLARLKRPMGSKARRRSRQLGSDVSGDESDMGWESDSEAASSGGGFQLGSLFSGSQANPRSKKPAGLFKKSSKALATIDARDAVGVSPEPLPPPPTEKRGRGMLEINYKRAFYDIWVDVVSFMYLRAKPLLDFGKEDEEMEDERRVRVVRFAGVVQRAFEGRVEQELKAATNPGTAAVGSKSSIVVAKGYIAGTIVHLGPKYSDYVGSFRDQQRWVGSWDGHYHTANELEKLRQMEEIYSAKILDYQDEDLARICPISSPETCAWSAAQPVSTYRRRLSSPSASDTGLHSHGDMASPRSSQSHDPVRFLGSDFCMGLAPTAARVGDLVIRFWRCDAAIVVRRPAAAAQPDEDAEYWLVGRADVAEPHKGLVERDSEAKGAMKVVEVADHAARNAKGEKPVPLPRKKMTRGVYVSTDYDTLQKISSAIEI